MFSSFLVAFYFIERKMLESEIYFTKEKLFNSKSFGYTFLLFFDKILDRVIV